jgi:hypothetical protein
MLHLNPIRDKRIQHGCKPALKTREASPRQRLSSKVFIGKDLDQAGISIKVRDITGKLGAGSSSEQGFRVRRGRFAEPGGFPA